MPSIVSLTPLPSKHYQLIYKVIFNVDKRPSSIFHPIAILITTMSSPILPRFAGAVALVTGEHFQPKPYSIYPD